MRTSGPCFIEPLRSTISQKRKLALELQAAAQSTLVLPHFRGHTIIVVEIQQEVFHDKSQKLSTIPC